MVETYQSVFRLTGILIASTPFIKAFCNFERYTCTHSAKHNIHSHTVRIRYLVYGNGDIAAKYTRQCIRNTQGTEMFAWCCQCKTIPLRANKIYSHENLQTLADCCRSTVTKLTFDSVSEVTLGGIDLQFSFPVGVGEIKCHRYRQCPCQHMVQAFIALAVWRTVDHFLL